MTEFPHSQTINLHYVESIEVKLPHRLDDGDRTPTQEIVICLRGGGRVEICCFAGGDKPVRVIRPHKARA